MSVFTEKEVSFLQSQRLGHLATVNAAGEPHMVPVNYTFNAELATIDIGGYRLAESKKFRDVARTGRAAFEVENGGGLTMRGRGEAISDNGQELIRVTPGRIVSWGIDTDSYEVRGRNVGGEGE